MPVSSRDFLTIADLDLLPDDWYRYELIEGELFVSSPPSLTHQRVPGELLVSLAGYLELNPIGEGLASPGVVFNQFSSVIPDMVFFINERRDEIASGEHITGAPDLVVEILSPGPEKERRDRIVKRDLYAKYGVKEYWIVDPALRSIEVYRRSGGALTLLGVIGPEGDLKSPLLPGYSSTVGDLFRP
jgi:Uma2 family endonuclease